MKQKEPQTNLSRRERQIMDILHRRGPATAAEIHESMPDAPSYSAVRATLRILEDKGHLRHETQDVRYIYLPTMPPEKAKRSAVKHLLATFFNGSAEQAVASLLDGSAAKLSKEELDRLSKLIDEARKEGL
jgi:BlaI family transcriptional regulator, penicillinase repressor